MKSNRLLLNFKDYLFKIDEGLIKSYDIDFVIDKGCQKLSVLNVPFTLNKNPNNTLKLTISNFNKVFISELFNLLNQNFTNLFGWFPSYMFMENISGMQNHMNYDENYLESTYEYLREVSIIYECKFDKIIDIPKNLYHISIQEYENKIKSIGICPKSKNKLSSDRIYVCSDIDNCLSIIPKMKFYFFNKNKNINTKWIIYKIYTEGLDLDLYNDPNYPGKGFYLLGNVPPSKIKIENRE